MGFIFRLVALLSLDAVRTLGRFIGRMLYRFDKSSRRNIDANLKRSGLFSEAFARRVAEETGVQAVEGVWVWQQDPSEILKRCSISREEKDLLCGYNAKNTPVVFLTPHIGTYEVAPIWLSQAVLKGGSRSMAIMFKMPGKAYMRSVVAHGRDIENIVPVTADLKGIRHMMRRLKTGDWAGILPDQVPTGGQGVWADFFGTKAYTMTLPLRIARQMGAKVIMVAVIRTKGGWEIRALPWEGELPEDPGEGAEILNQSVEKAVGLCPEQYLWAYNRYKCPAGVKRP